METVIIHIAWSEMIKLPEAIRGSEKHALLKGNLLKLFVAILKYCDVFWEILDANDYDVYSSSCQAVWLSFNCIEFVLLHTVAIVLTSSSS